MADLRTANLFHHSRPWHMAGVRAMTSIRRCDRRWRACNFFMLATLYLMGSASTALAHVKWFSNYNVAEQPVSMDQVVSGDFVPLIILAMLIFWSVAMVGAIITFSFGLV